MPNFPRPSAARPSAARPSAARRSAARPLAAGLLAAACLAAPAAFAQDDAPVAPPAVDAGPPPDAAAAADPDGGPKTGPPLPRGFVPPPEKPEAFTTVTPLMGEAELAEAERALDRVRYRDVLAAGPRDAAAREIVRDWAKWRVAKLTGLAPVREAEKDEDDDAPVEPPPPPGPLVDDRPALREAADDLLREANRSVAADLNGQDAERVKLEVFQILADELLALKDNHLVLRIVAARILGGLEVAGGGRAPGDLKRFGPGVVPLLTFFETAGEDDSALVDPELAVRQVVLVMLPLVARTGLNVPGEARLRAADVFAARLAGHPEDPGWFQAGLATALYRMQVRKPELARQVFAALSDADRPCAARASAAMALVRLAGVPADVRDALPDALDALARDVAAAYNAAPSADARDCFQRLEFAFKPMGRSELETLPGGTILSGTTVPGFLQPAYGRVHPLVKFVHAQDLATSPSNWAKIPDDLLEAAGVGPVPAAG